MTNWREGDPFWRLQIDAQRRYVPAQYGNVVTVTEDTITVSGGGTHPKTLALAFNSKADAEAYIHLNPSPPLVSSR